MNLPVLRRSLAEVETVPGEPTEPVIHYEVLDAASGTLLHWGSTTSLDSIVESATQARADLAGRSIRVRQLAEPSWAASAKWPRSSTGIEPHIHANRVRAAAGDLRRAAEDARTARVDPDLLRGAADPDLTVARVLLNSIDPEALDLVDLRPTRHPDYPDNLDRAGWAAQALAAFGKITGQLQDGPGTCAEEVEEMAGDLICDLMHLIDYVGGEAQATVERGIGHHDYEVREEADTAEAPESAA